MIFCCTLQGDIAKLREVYDGFLAEYPLCYGYWKKYADAEHRNGMPELAVSVFERGTAAIPYSVDLWGHMCTYKISQNASANEVRRCDLMWHLYACFCLLISQGLNKKITCEDLLPLLVLVGART